MISAYGSGPLPKIVLSREDTGTLLSISRDTRHIVIENLVLEAIGEVQNERPKGIFIGNFSGTGSHPSFITFNQIELKGAAEGVVNYGNSIAFLNSIFRDNRKTGIRKGDRASGMFNKGDYGWIQNCLFERNGSLFDEAEDSGNVYSWNLYQSSSHYLIENNIFRGGYTGVKMRGLSNILFRNNIIEDVGGMALTIGGDDDKGASEILVKSNIIRNAGDGIVVKRQAGDSSLDIDTYAKNLYFVNNLIHSNWKDLGATGGNGAYRMMIGFLTGGNQSLSDVYFVGNTVANLKDKAALQIGEDNGARVYVFNNIFHRLQPDARHQLVKSFGISVHGYNLYWDSGVEIPGKTDTEINLAPAFADAVSGNFELRSDSPARDSGMSLPAIYQDDLVASERASQYDMGCYESW